MDQARTLTAVFVTNQPILSVYSTYNTVLPSVGTHTSDYAAVITCEAATSTVTEGTTRYVCSGWTGSGCVPSTGATLSIDVLMTNNSSITWQWKRQYLLSATGGVNGSVTPTSVWHDNGETATVLAIADNGYQFSGWSGDVGFADTNQNPLTLTMDQARSVICPLYRAAPHPDHQQSTRNLQPGTRHLHHAPAGLLGRGTGLSNPISLQCCRHAVCLHRLDRYRQCTRLRHQHLHPVRPANQFIRQLDLENAVLAQGFRRSQRIGQPDRAAGTTPTQPSPSLQPPPVPTPLTTGPATCPLPTMVYDNPIVITMNQSRALSAFFTTNQPVLTVRSTYGTPDPAVGSHTGAYARTRPLLCRLRSDFNPHRHPDCTTRLDRLRLHPRQRHRLLANRHPHQPTRN